MKGRVFTPELHIRKQSILKVSSVDYSERSYYCSSVMSDRTIVPRRVIWCLLAVWLCLGCVAFVEQANSLSDTSDQDEQALSQLSLTLKPEIPPLPKQLTSSVPPIVIIPSVIRLSDVSQFASIPSQPLTLRSHQRVSVYRI